MSRSSGICLALAKDQLSSSEMGGGGEEALMGLDGGLACEVLDFLVSDSVRFWAIIVMTGNMVTIIIAVAFEVGVGAEEVAGWGLEWLRAVTVDVGPALFPVHNWRSS